MKKQALLLVAEDDPDDQYFFQEAVEVACPGEVETHYVCRYSRSCAHNL